MAFDYWIAKLLDLAKIFGATFLLSMVYHGWLVFL